MNWKKSMGDKSTMSSSAHSPGREKGDKRRTVTDSVHERFRQSLIYCKICQVQLPANNEAIQKHFGISHPSNKFCQYCKKKVYLYYTIDDDNNCKTREYVYHRCHH
ncbi:uncharacterized protein LOC107268055 [Cephus cinctus]|uniref:Uncharacterized protein LOC107268055 n=1 Tax=Cephus cinctus TaxID=211228 RepID=A0AAJ7BXE2_CEPCN|nr:uncharacterized protein LOC107268055 [Cephus cinctus]